MQVGWIGLGGIGGNMALRVLDAGHKLVAYDRGVSKDKVAQKGAVLLADYVAVARDCDVVCVCVFSDAQVREVMLDSGALAVMRAGSVLAIHTTGSPVVARELGERAPDGVDVLDACFSGGPQETERGDLTLMVGGKETALETARPVLCTYASRINLLGPLGAGQALKLLNNLLFSSNLQQAAEIIGIAEAQGIDPLLAAKVIQQSSGASMAMGLLQNAAPDRMMANVRPYMVKDIKAAAIAAEDAEINISNFAPTIEYFS